MGSIDLGYCLGVQGGSAIKSSLPVVAKKFSCGAPVKQLLGLAVFLNSCNFIAMTKSRDRVKRTNSASTVPVGGGGGGVAHQSRSNIAVVARFMNPDTRTPLNPQSQQPEALNLSNPLPLILNPPPPPPPPPPPKSDICLGPKNIYN